ncbi:MAG: hypothetical protein LKM44_02445 [Wolbachia endosymbiont of Meromenopon meropis]|nr:hypothetical protein [Wolbachia endosymbiont of Meromenopon meropis]
MKKKIKFTWKIDEFFTKNKISSIKKINKIIFNLVVTTINVVVKVEEISVLLRRKKDKTLLTIQILSEHESSSKALIEKLTKKRKNRNINAKDINIYMICLLLKQCNTEALITYENKLLEICLTFT